MKNWQKILIGITVVVIIIAVIGIVWFNSTFISKSEIKEIILNNMNLSEKDVHFESVDLELDEEYYEIEVYYNNREYEYKINCKTGTILYTDYKEEKHDKPVNNRPDNNSNDVGTQNNVNENNNAVNETNTNNSYLHDTEVTEDTARGIAMKHAGVPAEASNVSFKKTEKDYEQGKLVYEIEFIYDNYEYEYKIAVEDGSILEHSKERA